MMNKQYTSLDIALLAGVSQSTVSRALAGRSSISAATRKRIEEIAERLGYQVDLRARHLRTHQTGALTLLLFADDMSAQIRLNPFYLSMIGAITCAANQRGYDLMVSFQQLSSNWHDDYQKSRKSDGLILLGYGNAEQLKRNLSQMIHQGTHFVRWGCTGPSHPGLSVGCDNLQGGRCITEHLISLGRRKIAFVGDVCARSPEFHDRFRGYRAALAGSGIGFRQEMQVDARLNDERSGYTAVEKLLASGAQFDALVAASDQLAIAAIRALAVAGRRVPDDVAVVGFDDIPLASLINPPLTTVRQDPHQAGAALINALIGQIAAERPSNTTLPAELIVRQSCGA